MAPRRKRLLALLALLACGLVASAAHAADRWVSTSGDDTGNACLVAAAPCRTVAHANSQATSGDVINVAAGLYYENVRTSGSADLTFLGGWDPGFTARDPRANLTTLRGGELAPHFVDRIFTIYAFGPPSTITIDGFTIERGKVGSSLDPFGGSTVGSEGAGGGLAALSNGALTLNVSNTTITRNLARHNPPGGGGVALVAAPGALLNATFTAVVVSRNSAPRTNGGGGILVSLRSGPGITPEVHVTLVNSMVTQNRTSNGLGGGGILFQSGASPGPGSTLTLINSTVTGNATRVNRDVPYWYSLATGGGGGLNVSAYPSSPPITVDVSNTILSGNKLGAIGVGRDLLLVSPAGAVTLDHSDVHDAVAFSGALNDGGGNVDLPAFFTKGYHLGANSPLIDAGTCAGAPATDIDGDPRPSGPGCDIGADELVP